MYRRTFLKIATAGVLEGALAFSSKLSAFGKTRPNVVLIVADDLGYNDLNCCGSTISKTPYIDSLAQNGTRFTQFYVCPSCTPTRFSLLTGWHVNRSTDELFGALIYNENKQDIARGLRSDKTTLADVFKGNGYSTALVGKWHLGMGEMCAEPSENGASDSEFHPNNHGFDYFYGPLSGAIDYNTHWVQSFFQDWFENKNYIPGGEQGGYATHLFTQRAVEFINGHNLEPFFLYLPYTAPHGGNIPKPRTTLETSQLPVGEETERKYLSRFDHLWGPEEDTTNIQKRYLAMMAVLDDGVGEILDALKKNNLEENTLVIFISDNGGRPECADNGPLRDYKGSLFEGGIRAPAIMQWKGIIPEEKVSDQIASGLDMFLTIAKLAGLNMSGYRTDGIDLRSNIFGGGIIERDLFYNFPIGNVYRRGKWKYLKRKNNEDELYDLEADIGETTNLASTYPEKLNELKTLHADQTANLGNPPPFPPVSDAQNWRHYNHKVSPTYRDGKRKSV